jgi:hypothetical protein
MVGAKPCVTSRERPAIVEANFSGKGEPMRHTKNCIFCGKPAMSWCGHVQKDDEAVIAGTCKPCSLKPFAPGNMPLPPMPGNVVSPEDIWRPEHGIEEGLDLNGASVSFDGTEASLAIAPKGEAVLDPDQRGCIERQ